MTTRKFEFGYSKLQEKRVKLFIESQKRLWINL